MTRVLLLCCLALVIGCRGSATVAPAAPAAAAAPAAEVRVPVVTTTTGASMRMTWPVPPRAGQLTDSQLVALAPRIARLRAEPDTLRVDVTDSLNMARLVRVLALDDNGAVLGEVTRYTFAFVGSIYPEPSGVVRASRAGAGIFGASIRRDLAGEFRTRGPAQVIVITTDSTGAGARMLEVPKGTGVITGVVRDSLGQPLPRAQVLATRTIGAEVITLTRGVADTEGRYRLEGLPAGALTVRASWRGHRPISENLTLGDGAAVTRDLQLAPLGTTQLTRPRPPGLLR